MAGDDPARVVTLQRREPQRSSRVVAEDELHGSVAEAAEAVVEKNRAVEHG